MEINKNSRNIVMWLRKTEDHLSEGFFSKKKKYAYHKFFKKISELDNFRFAFGAESYIGDGVFSNVAI